jgi:hypothetical protein
LLTVGKSGAPAQSREKYTQGNYNTVFMDEIPNEKQLIFKVQQRKVTMTKTIAEHVVSQLNPDWRSSISNPNTDLVVLRSELKEFFKLSRESRIIEDLTLFKVTADKKVTVHVDQICNLPDKGTLS